MSQTSPAEEKPTTKDVTTVASTFPTLTQPLVSREHFAQTIVSLFDAGNEVVVVEGPEGVGKTTFAAQIAKSNPSTSISVFIRSASRLGYDLTYLTDDLCTQIAWLLGDDISQQPTTGRDGYYRSLLLRLQRQTRLNTYFFIVDGLDEIPEADRQQADMLLDLLPLGYRGFRFILTARDSAALRKLSKLKVKPYPLATLSPDETGAMFAGLGIDRETILEFHRTCRGMPHYLSSVRRSLAAGESATDLIAKAGEKLTHLFELEWNRLNSADRIQQMTLALMAFNYGEQTLSSVAILLDVPAKTVKDAIGSLPFVLVDQNDERLEFVSNTFKSMVETRLARLRSTSINLVIDRLLLEPNSDAAIAGLPRKLKEAGRADELLQFLSPKYFDIALARCQSFAPLQHSAVLGMEAALQRQSDPDLVRFALHRSVIREIEKADVWTDEVRALAAIGNFPEALAQAMSAPLIENRLQMLAAVTKIRRERGKPIESEVLEEIRQIYKRVDPSALGQRAFSIARDLVADLPEIARNLIERAPATDVGDHEDEVALTRQYLQAGLDEEESDVRTSTLSSLIRERIRSEPLKRLSDAVRVAFGNHTAAAVIAEADKIGTVNVQVAILSEWATRNRSASDALAVTRHGLDVIIRGTEYTPSATDALRLCMPLLHTTDHEGAHLIVNVVDGLKGSFERYGPTAHYVELQLTIAQAELNAGRQEAASSRVLEAYFFVDSLEDPEAKADCLARLHAFLVRACSDLTDSTMGGLAIEVAQKLESAFDDLLKHTAPHQIIAKPILRNLARDAHVLAREMALKLNTDVRRDMALANLADATVKRSRGAISLEPLLQTISQIHDSRLSDEALLAITRALSEGNISAQDAATVLPRLFGRIQRVKGFEDRASGLANLYLAVVDSPSHAGTGLADAILAAVRTALSHIDPAWRRCELGFELSSRVAKVAPEVAIALADFAVAAKADSHFDASETAYAYTATLRLAASAFSGLLLRRADDGRDILRLADLVDIVPSMYHRALFWADIACRYVCADRTDDAKKIAQHRLLPLLYTLRDGDEASYLSLIRRIVPVLYAINPTSTMTDLRSLPRNLKDECLQTTIQFIYTREPLFEPYDPAPAQEYKLNYVDVIHVCELLELMDSDWGIFDEINRLADLFLADKRRSTFTGEQRREVIRRLDLVIGAKLPAPHGIRHAGYKVVSEVALDRIRDTVSQTWHRHADALRAIPNIADCAFGLTILAESLPSKLRSEKVSLLTEAATMTEQVPSLFDRANHLRGLGEALGKVDPLQSKLVLKRVMELSNALPNESEEVDRLRRSTIDYAYRVNPDLARELVATYDNDPARVKQRDMLNQRMKSLEARRDLSKGDLKFTSDEIRRLPEWAWSLLGRLHSRQITPLRPEQIRSYVEKCSVLPISDAYPVVAWVVANLVIKYRDTENATRLLRPLFESVLFAAQISARMAARNAALATPSAGIFRPLGDGSVTVRAGQREGAVNYLKEWIEKDVTEFLKICDPYFGLEDLEILRWVAETKPGIKVWILTGVPNSGSASQLTRENCVDYWTNHLSANDPPETEVCVVYTRKDRVFPIHDRWWLSGGSGLRIGTSVNSVGLIRESEISRLSDEEVAIRLADVDQYFTKTTRLHLGEKLVYSTFML